MNRKFDIPFLTGKFKKRINLYPINFKIMKPIISCLSVFLLVTINSFSQVLQKKQTTAPVVERNTITKSSVLTGKTQGSVNQNPNTKTDNSKATLLNASFFVVTASNSSSDPATNKAANTHWSCTLFDQNNRQVASFYDDSNNDAYPSGSQTPVLKMQVANATVLGDFSKGGRFHISITPNENDTWEISDFNLTIDFHDPIFTQKLMWNGIKLSEDKKDVDLFFNNNAGNSDLKYDLKANKRS